MAENPLRAMLIDAVVIGSLTANQALQAGSPILDAQHAGSVRDKSTKAENDTKVSHRFAPMWIPVPRFPPDPDSEVGLQPPSAAHALVWNSGWQAEIGLSAEQKARLREIHTRAMAEVEQHIAEFQRLPLEDQKARAESWGGGSAPWRNQFDANIREQIEAVLTPQQLQTLRDYSAPIHMVGLLYDAHVRRDIDFGPEQQAQFRRVIKERLARFQDEYLKRADLVWDLLTPRQRSELPALVRSQGPTSAVLSLAYDLAFDFEALELPYPMLAQKPVREQLHLSAEQEKQLQAAMEDAARDPQPDEESDAEHSRSVSKASLDAILTPWQLSRLNEIDFRRRVVLALSYPEKRASIDFTADQTAALQQLNQETHERLYQIDREMLAKAMQIPTLPQRHALNALIVSELGE